MSFEKASQELQELIAVLKMPGEKVSVGFYLRRPETLAALETAVQALQLVTKKKAYPISAPGVINTRRGQLWTDDEDQRLKAAYDSGRTLDQLARDFGRSESSISGRLMKLGRVSGWDD